jgi:hypothetical protein
MTAPASFLDRIRIATPCSASWDAMQGDDRSRFCGECRLNVYNLSAMSRGEAESLLRGATGRVCTRFVRRADGTVVTQDCGPVRLAIRRRLRRLHTVAATLLGALCAFALAACGHAPADAEPTATTIPTTSDPVEHPVPTPDPMPLMGAVAPDELMGEVCVPDEYLGRVATPRERADAGATDE